MQLLRPMRPVSVEVMDGADAGTYTSRVLDFTEGEQIVIAAPLERGREVQPQPDTPVHLQFTRPDGLHVLPTRVLDRSAARHTLRLAWPEQKEHVQRRSHARVEVLVRCEIAPSRPDGEEEETLPALISNLGVGGVLLTLPVPMEPDAQARVTLHLPGLGPRSCEALVLRGGEVEGAAENHRYWAALEFAGMLESMREDLASFVIELQRDALRRPVEATPAT
jgi:c-di-GMP-binding flagellar brake protein YcgR